MSSFKEIDIENFIWERLSGREEELENRGFWVSDGAHYRQFNLPGCGVADIVSFCPYVEKGVCYLRINIYELKRGHVDAKCLTQIIRYMSYLTECAPGIAQKFTNGAEIIVHGHLVGATFDPEVLAFENAFPHAWITLIKYEISLSQGITFSFPKHKYYNPAYQIDDIIPESRFGWIKDVNRKIEACQASVPGESVPQTDEIPF